MWIIDSLLEETALSEIKTKKIIIDIGVYFSYDVQPTAPHRTTQIKPLTSQHSHVAKGGSWSCISHSGWLLAQWGGSGVVLIPQNTKLHLEPRGVANTAVNSRTPHWLEALWQRSFSPLQICLLRHYKSEISRPGPESVAARFLSKSVFFVSQQSIPCNKNLKLGSWHL